MHVGWLVRVRAETTAGGEGVWSYGQATQSARGGADPDDRDHYFPERSTSHGRASSAAGKTLKHYYFEYWSGSLEDPGDYGEQNHQFERYDAED